MNSSQTNRKNKIIILFIFIIFFGLYFNRAEALRVSGTEIIKKGIHCQVPEGDIEKVEEAVDKQIAKGGMKAISTIDLLVAGEIKKVNCTDTRGFMARAMDQITSWAIQEKKWLLEEAARQAYKAALKNFLDTLAFDMATYLATGDKGQLPMFETQSWGDYLKNAADNAAGAALEELGKKSPIKFNLCSPDPEIMLKISLNLGGARRPKPPACTFSQLRDNWEAALNDKDFLPKFQDMFNPWSNDLGIALTLQTGIEAEISRAVNEALETRREGGGFKAVTDPITKYIKTPSKLVIKTAEKTIEDSNKDLLTYTGSAIADAFDLFVNTLIGKLIDQWLKKGLVTDFGSRRWNTLANPDAQKQDEGIAGAESRFRTLIEPNFKVRGDYDILAELATCPDPNKAGPTNCVIDQKFREAIEKRLTVNQAIAQGYLSVNGVFGFTADGLEPKYNEGYPYRSMLILRKFRIIPLGWEVAAQKIKDRQNEIGGTKNLKDLVTCAADDWCAGLVDPNWVLKAPQNFCGKEGAGPEILSEQVMGEGAASSLSILRNGNYCADEKSLIKENSDGSNPLYGYCAEERRTWDFNAKACAPRDNTCQTFQLDGEDVSYLQNTLDFSICNAGNAGCQKYASGGSFDTDKKSIIWDGDIDPIYLNKNAADCEAAEEGCHEFIRILPEKSETYEQIKSAGLDKAYERFSLTGRIYEKLLPDYLVDKKDDGGRKDYDEGACYDERGRLKASAPARCFDFARRCQEEEAGCELYKSLADDSKVPAKVKPNDYCPIECVGYDTFIQKETIFDSGRPAFLIPKTAKICSAESAGCDEFTNLEKIATSTPNVAERKEYYSYLRQCIKPDTEGKTCGEFYSWEGSDETGYQLKVFSLQADGAGPAVTEDDAALCNAEIYNYPLSNPAYNPDCRQFYNRAGEIFYHLYKLTISCSEDCHPYRRTELNIDQNISEAGDCSGASQHWDEENSRCVVCKSGGFWSADNNGCIYLAIPSQGAVCSAEQTGCREYSGNTGNDIRNIFTDDFSGGLTGSWAGFNGSEVTPSSEALTLDADNKGNSLNVAGSPFSASRLVSGAVRQHKSYVLSFLAKAANSTNFNISLAAGVSGARAEFAQIRNVGADWQIYKTNLIDLNHEVAADEILLIEAGQNFYIDSVALTEIVDRYYLIKDSWRTPLACDSELDGVYHEHYMLGCDQYVNRAGEDKYLKSFSELCSESAVGCELMIDTKNSTSITTEEFINDGTIVTVPADEFIYAVYDQNKLCNKEAKGCALLGQAYEYEDAIIYGDVHLRNNPDNYKTILCGAEAVGCQIFSYGQGAEKYFKDPGDQVCEWRRQIGAGDREDWFKKKIKRCGGDDDAVCLSDNDCSGGLKCQTETADRECPVSDDKTLGLAGAGGRVSQPGEDDYGKWAGICAAANSGCGEYIDPVSRFNANLIFNGSFTDLDNDGQPADGWNALRQDVTLEPNTVYRLARSAEAGQLGLSGCPDNLYEINSNNNLTPAAEIMVGETDYANSKVFNYRGDDKVSCVITAGNPQGVVELKPVVIDYQLAQNLDRQSCNGVVDFNKGCVLFNERSQAGASLTELKWDADTGAISGEIVDQDKDSNVILKVMPDRVCDKWLACRSFVKDEKGGNTCYDVGLCDAVDDKGDCLSFIFSPKNNQTIESLGADKISNLSGYAKVGLNNGSLGGDYYPLGAMQQKGEVADLANGGFEFYGANGYPVGWSWSGQALAKKPWDDNVFSVINNPIEAQIEGIDYAREGRAFLKLGSSYDAVSEEVDVLPRTDYIITAYVNTKNLKSGQAMIDILDRNGASLATVIAQALGNDWQFQVGQFKSGADSIIKVKLYASAGGAPGAEGNFYFDDIKIRPALESKCKDNCTARDYLPWYTTQSCRLYPKTDSLACDYFEDSGKRQKGWPGYCLEYDRWPGNPNTCLLWYPIDRVKGDGLEEGASYNGKFPVYYCLEAERPETLNGQCSIYFKTGTEQEIILGNPYIVWDINRAKISVHEGGGANESIYGLALRNYFDQKWTGMVRADIVGDDRGRTWDLAKDFDQIKMFDAVKLTCIDGDAHSDENDEWYVNNCECSGFTAEEGIKSAAKCNIIAQTVSSVGQNKYWSSRVHEGSDYKLSCNLSFGDDNYVDKICSYNSDQTPFGSIVPPANSLSSLSNPYEWDSSPAAGKQPLYYGPDNGQARMGQELLADNIKQIFAKSYGAWQWNQQICQGGVKAGAECVTNNDCQGFCNKTYCVRTIPGPNQITGQSCEADVISTCDNLSGGSCVNATGNICLGGHKDLSPCNVIGSNDCKGCTGQSLGVCNNDPLRCQGGANNGVACLTDDSCNSCESYDVGNCVSNICEGGNKAGDSCTSNTCGREHTCSSGSKAEKYCDSDNDCNDCKGCSGSSFGTCESADTCQGGNRAGLFCSDDSECNSCGDFNVGDCVQKKTCDSGCHKDEVCIDKDHRSDNGLCKSTRCYFCLPSVCSDGLTTCAGDNAVCSGVCPSAEYKKIDQPYWGPPGTLTNLPLEQNNGLCPPPPVGRAADAYCAILPAVNNIKVQGRDSGAVKLKTSQFINLTFNSKADSQQLPLVMYAVDWGDNEKTVMSGAEMNDRPEESGQEHSLYHLYSYWDLKAKFNTGLLPPGSSCGLGQCEVKIKVQIKDNWGWCNRGQTINICGDEQWDYFSGTVVVREK